MQKYMYMYEHLVELIRVSAQFSSFRPRDSRSNATSSSRGPLETSPRHLGRVYLPLTKNH